MTRAHWLECHAKTKINVAASQPIVKAKSACVYIVCQSQITLTRFSCVSYNFFPSAFHLSVSLSPLSSLLSVNQKNTNHWVFPHHNHHKQFIKPLPYINVSVMTVVLLLSRVSSKQAPLMSHSFPRINQINLLPRLNPPSYFLPASSLDINYVGGCPPLQRLLLGQAPFKSLVNFLKEWSRVGNPISRCRAKQSTEGLFTKVMNPADVFHKQFLLQKMIAYLSYRPIYTAFV